MTTIHTLANIIAYNWRDGEDRGDLEALLDALYAVRRMVWLPVDQRGVDD